MLRNGQRGFVPVEANPLHAATVALYGEFGQVFQQGLAIAPTSFFGKDEQVLKIQALASDESGEIVEKQGKADDRTVFLGEDHLGGMLHKQGMVQSGFVGHNFIGAFLVNRKFLDEFKDETRLIGPCGTNGELRVHNLMILRV